MKTYILDVLNSNDNLLIKLCGWMLIILAPILNIIYAIWFIIFIDFVTGMIASAKRDGIKSISVIRFMVALPKLILYPLGILGGYVVELYLCPELPFTRIACGFIGAWEMKSVYRNITTATGLDIWGAVKDYIFVFKKNKLNNIDNGKS